MHPTRGNKSNVQGWCSARFLLPGGFIFYYYLSMPHNIVLWLWLLPNALEAVRDIPFVKYVSYYRGMFHDAFSLIKTNVSRRKQYQAYFVATRKESESKTSDSCSVCVVFLFVYGVLRWTWRNEGKGTIGRVLSVRNEMRFDKRELHQ